jgi:hypothetical protein
LTTSKGGRPATGAVKWQYSKKYGRDCWHGRVKLADNSRPWVPLDPSIPADDEPRARACAVKTAEWFKTHSYAPATSASDAISRLHKYKQRGSHVSASKVAKLAVAACGGVDSLLEAIGQTFCLGEDD